MAINKNHECEELNGIKCAIVERNVSESRANFLTTLLKSNGFEVKVAAANPVKTAMPAEPVSEANVTETVSLFTVGVTDLTFNPINAIFGRLLKTPDKKVVTLAYWQQKSSISNDEIPYFDIK